MSKTAEYKFRLYMAGDSPNSMQALNNLKAFCQEHLPGQHQIEVVNVILDTNRALADGVFLTPTLVKLSPAPVRKVVGSLSHLPSLLQVLELTA
jgi:circadian clock protein KaiB